MEIGKCSFVMLIDADAVRKKANKGFYCRTGSRPVEREKKIYHVFDIFQINLIYAPLKKKIKLKK